MGLSPLICLVTPAHPASNPRLVKEAATLQAAGYRVHVVAGRYFPPLDAFDHAIYSQAAWSRTVVDYSSGFSAAAHRGLRRLIRRALSQWPRLPPPLAARAHHAAVFPLAATASRIRADLYIGHCLAGLAAAGLAAERTGARLGFDAEDFHSAETSQAETEEIHIIRSLESHWLPRCAHFTASSPQIAAAYRDARNLPFLPISLLNTFPLAEAPAAPRSARKPGEPPRLYWFSQTVGPDRGLEPLMKVLGRLRTRCELQLRGIPSRGFPERLRELARRSGFAGTLDFVPMEPPEKMVALSAEADLGLSLEQTVPRNRDLCLTNKIFTCLLAGTPVALTPTAAQTGLAAELGEAALPLDLAQPESTAARLDEWLADPTQQAAARSAAWRLGRTRYHWETQIPALLDSVAAAVGQIPRMPAR